MTIHEAIFSAVREPLLGILYLLLTVQMALVFAAFRDGRSLRVRLGMLVPLLLSFGWLWLALLDIDSNYFVVEAPILLPEARSGFTPLPVWVLFAYEAVGALVAAIAFLDRRRWRRTHPTFGSIKKAMDMFPVGVAFARLDGTVVLSNLAMNNLSYALTDSGISDMEAFREKAGMTGTEAQLSAPDGSAVWQLASRTLHVDGEPYIQLTAVDITQEAAVMRQLEEKHGKLCDIQMRLKIYNQQAERMVVSKELLAARMAVHNELGSVLLESRHYLVNPSFTRESALLEMLKSANARLLKDYERDDAQRDPLADALELAEAIGVRVELRGVVPQGDSPREILAAAITECAINAVKHADGDALVVAVDNADGRLSYVLASNGTPPQQAIMESGGLASLRLLVEKAGGAMELDSAHHMQLRIDLQSPEFS